MTMVKLENNIELFVTEYNKADVDADGRASIVFLHGWPQLAYSWRHQLAHFGAAGRHVIAYDARGCGRSSKPALRTQYAQRHLLSDAQLLLIHLQVSRVIIVGHDWGAVTTWHLALSQEVHELPFQVVGVVSLNTPYYPYDASMGSPRLTAAFDYQRYLQDSSRAAAELNADIARSLMAIIRGHADQHIQNAGPYGVVERGGLLVGVPNPCPASTLLPPAVLSQYVAAYSLDGFEASLHVYNNYKENAEFRRETRDAVINCPVLMITAGNDPILTPESSSHMELFIPNLTRGHVEQSSHWTMEEFPDRVNKLIEDFINGIEGLG